MGNLRALYKCSKKDGNKAARNEGRGKAAVSVRSQSNSQSWLKGDFGNPGHEVMSVSIEGQCLEPAAGAAAVSAASAVVQLVLWRLVGGW